MPQETYRVIVHLPFDYLEKMMNAIQDQIDPISTKYSRCFSYWPVKSTWKTEKGQKPFNGEEGKITVADEYVLEFVCRKSESEKVFEIIKKIHPYEEPQISFEPQIVY